MYVILVYDISMDNSGARILNKVFKICKKYLSHIQNSVFEGELTESQILKIQMEIKEHIRTDKDSIIIFKSKNKRWLEKEFLGKVDDRTTSFL